MNKKLLYTIILIIIVLLIFGLVYFFLIKKMSISDLSDKNKLLNSVKTQTDQNVGKVKINANQQLIDEASKIELSNKPITKEYVSKLAASFAERFGSYSNHANFKNFF